jgi:hypothetical protein
MRLLGGAKNASAPEQFILTILWYFFLNPGLVKRREKRDAVRVWRIRPDVDNA